MSKARQLSSGSSGTDEAKRKPKLLRGAEVRTKTEQLILRTEHLFSFTYVVMCDPVSNSAK